MPKIEVNEKLFFNLLGTKYDWDTFEKNPVEFYCVVSDCESGTPIYKKLTDCRGPEMDWLRASASMPLVSKPVRVDGKILLDGGMTDSIPLKAFENLGFEKKSCSSYTACRFCKTACRYERTYEIISS